MRQLALTVTTALLAIGLIGSPLHAEQIQWAQNLDQARLLASQQNKLLLIHFWTPDCGPCKTIESKVFPTAMVADAINEHFVPLKVNAYENEQLRTYFGVQKWPTDVVCTVDGRALSQMVTSQDPARYVNTLMMIAGQNQNARPAGVSQQTTNYVASQPNASYSQTPPQQQSPPTTDWSAHKQMPSMQANTAMARRPGLDPAMRPGTGQHMQTPRFESTPSNLGADMAGREVATPGMADNQNFVDNQTGAADTKRSRFDNDSGTATGPSNLVSQAPIAIPVEVTNRFAITSDPRMDRPIMGQPGTGQPNMGQPSRSSAGMPSAGSVAANPHVDMSSSGSQYSTPYTGRQGATSAPSTSMAGTQANVVENRFATPANQAQQQPSQNRYDSPSPNNLAVAPAQTGADRQTSSSADLAQNAAPQTESLGLDGRCPVTLITQNKWVAGDKRWGAVHRGKTYLFAGPAQQQKFLMAPDNFSPVLAGIDVVKLASAGRVVEGTRRFGVLFDDDGDDGPRQSRIYLFDSADSRNRFEAEPDTFLQPVMQAMQTGNLNSLIR